jgi:hypothetical protein
MAIAYTPSFNSEISGDQIEQNEKPSNDSRVLHFENAAQSTPHSSVPSPSPFVFLPSEFWKNIDMSMETQPDLRLSIFMNELYNVLPAENQVTLPSFSTLLPKDAEAPTSVHVPPPNIEIQIPTLNFVTAPPKETQSLVIEVSTKSKQAESKTIPSNYQFGSKRKRWSEVDMEMAMELVRSRKMSCRAAAMSYNLPRSTLWDRVSQRGTKKLRQSQNH